MSLFQSDIWEFLILLFNQQFLIFKQYYTYFYIFFHLYVFSQNNNNVIRNFLPNRCKIDYGSNFFFFLAQFFKDKNFCHNFFYNLEFVKVIDNKGLSLSVGFNSFLLLFFHTKINCNKNCIPTFCHPMIETGNASPI